MNIYLSESAALKDSFDDINSLLSFSLSVTNLSLSCWNIPILAVNSDNLDYNCVIFVLSSNDCCSYPVR